MSIEVVGQIMAALIPTLKQIWTIQWTGLLILPIRTHSTKMIPYKIMKYRQPIASIEIETKENMKTKDNFIQVEIMLAVTKQQIKLLLLLLLLLIHPQATN